jgi:hypothetical protein
LSSPYKIVKIHPTGDEITARVENFLVQRLAAQHTGRPVNRIPKPRYGSRVKHRLIRAFIALDAQELTTADLIRNGKPGGRNWR